MTRESKISSASLRGALMSVVGGGAEGGGGADDDVICTETAAAGAFFVEEEAAARAAYTLAKGKKDVAFQAFAAYTSAPDGKAFLDEKAYKEALLDRNAAQALKSKYETAIKNHRSKKGHSYEELVLRASNETARAKETEVVRARTHEVWKATQLVKKALNEEVKIATDEAKEALKNLNRYTMQAMRGFEDVEGCPMVSLHVFVCPPAVLNRPNPRLTLPPHRSSSAVTAT